MKQTVRFNLDRNARTSKKLFTIGLCSFAGDHQKNSRAFPLPSPYSKTQIESSTSASTMAREVEILELCREHDPMYRPLSLCQLRRS